MAGLRRPLRRPPRDQPFAGRARERLGVQYVLALRAGPPGQAQRDGAGRVGVGSAEPRRDREADPRFADETGDGRIDPLRPRADLDRGAQGPGELARWLPEARARGLRSVGVVVATARGGRCEQNGSAEVLEGLAGSGRSPGVRLVPVVEVEGDPVVVDGGELAELHAGYLIVVPRASPELSLIHISEPTRP